MLMFRRTSTDSIIRTYETLPLNIERCAKYWPFAHNVGATRVTARRAGNANVKLAEATRNPWVWAQSLFHMRSTHPQVQGDN